MQLRTIEDLNYSGKNVFLRLDLNVPLHNGKITDDTRIQKAIPTILKLKESAKILAIASHLGRPKGESNPEFSLKVIGERISELTGYEIIFVEDYLEEPVEQIFPELQEHQIILFENLRFHKGETKNDPQMGRDLVRGFDIYVNDAFGCCHRAHASIDASPKQLPENKRAAGPLICKEVEVLDKLAKNPKSPFVVVMGGSKVSDKIGVLLNLLESANDVLIGGAMAYTFLKERGYNVGDSRVEHDKLGLVKEIYQRADIRKVKIHLPVDHLTGKEFSENTESHSVGEESIPDGFMGLDIGPRTRDNYKELILNAGTVFWNGPMGVFEWDQFSKGSLMVAEAMAETRATTIVGGGDSVAVLSKTPYAEKMTHISTGGGASLEFLEGKMLPGLKILDEVYGSERD